MSRKPYYTSNTLIEAVKRKMAFPIAQVTFSDEDILAFADEEMFLSQVPSILQYHEEYLVYTQEVPLVASKSSYAIPSRAIGMKLRDLFYKDTAGQIAEMSRVNPDDKSFFEIASGSSPTPIHYYLENNSIVIVPEVTQNATGSLMFSYFLRPNSLVTDENAAICESFSKTITVDNTTLISGDTITFDGSSAEAGTDFAIGVNSATTATNLATYINTLTTTQFSAEANSSVVTLFYEERDVEVTTTNEDAFDIQATITLNTSDVPSGITAGSLVDILQTDGGHNTLAFDVRLGQNTVSMTSITLTEDQLPDDFVIGDYICAQYECIVPQVPTDLHNLLAERTCARILESLGDKDGLQTANAKIAELEGRQSTILDNRVEGSPQKVLNRNGLLRSGRVGFGRRSY
jgi:hypothetical protein